MILMIIIIVHDYFATDVNLARGTGSTCLSTDPASFAQHTPTLAAHQVLFTRGCQLLPLTEQLTNRLTEFLRSTT